MDRLKRTLYENAFKLKFYETDGNAFQNFFSDIMGYCHPADFQRVCPWGKVGDRKNDGYLRSMRTLFQVYAPNEMKSSRAIAKIKQDFNGALPYWEAHFDTWVFVHNSAKGLGPDIVKTLRDLEAEHPHLAVRSWGFHELRMKVFSLTEVDLSSLFGTMPSDRDLMDVRFDDIEEVVAAIAEQPSPSVQDVRPVPRNKLAFNRLADDEEELIKYGMRKAHLVGQFFNTWPEPEFGDRIAAAFRQKYLTCRELKFSPDSIFQELHQFAGGYKRDKPRREAAVLAVLAYLFEQCEIFERPPEGAIL